MVRLEKSGVIMVVAEAMAEMFEDMGYTRVADVEPVAPVVTMPETPVESEEVESHDETEKSDEKKYSRSEITRMSTADLKNLAKSIGIEVTEESTGKVLKEEILNKLGL